MCHSVSDVKQWKLWRKHRVTTKQTSSQSEEVLGRCELSSRYLQSCGRSSFTTSKIDNLAFMNCSSHPIVSLLSSLIFLTSLFTLSLIEKVQERIGDKGSRSQTFLWHGQEAQLLTSSPFQIRDVMCKHVRTATRNNTTQIRCLPLPSISLYQSRKLSFIKSNYSFWTKHWPNFALDNLKAHRHYQVPLGPSQRVQCMSHKRAQRETVKHQH